MNILTHRRPLYFWIVLANSLALMISAEFFIPTFYRLKVKTTFEYLELRFTRAIRQLTMIMYFITSLVYCGLATFIPSTALSAVTGMSNFKISMLSSIILTGIDLNVAVLTTGCVCTFYTALGGMRGVIMTDVFMSVWMVAGLFAVTIKASNDIGFDTIWEKANNADRLDFFPSSWDMTVRNSLQV